HSPGFVWNFSGTVRVCFTCYREMGEETRKRYARGDVKSEPNKSGYSAKMLSILALLIIILGVSAYFLSKPLVEDVTEHRVVVREHHRHVVR
ncbi:MAG TPA: hypothetical protein VK961_01845, partial [Chthoniobacter sp.]|nr:hypothetical protein [Chthoniobacter sp.]